jgi:hypothetical protein
MTAKN